MAAELEQQPLRELLKECWPDADPKLFAALKRCAGPVAPFEFYESLNGLLDTHVADELLRCTEIGAQAVRFFQCALTLDPLVAPAHLGLHHHLGKAQDFNAVIQLLRQLGVLEDDLYEARALRKLKDSSLMAFFDKRLDRCNAPIMLGLRPPLRQIVNGKELKSVSNKFSNCLKDTLYRAQLGLGTHVFVVLEQPPYTAVASLERTAVAWHLDECEMLGHEKAPPIVRQKIVALLREHGVPANISTFSKVWSDMAPYAPIDWIERAWDMQFAATCESVS